MPPFGKPTPGLFDDPGIDDPGIADPGNADPGIASALGDDLSWTDLGAAELGSLASSLVTDPESRRGVPGTGTPVITTPVVLPTEPASPTAFTIKINWDASVASAPAGFTSDILAAVNFLETLFISPITITINIGYEEIAGNALGSNDLGESLSNMATVSYADLLSAVSASASTAVDASVAASLPATNPVSGSTDWVTTAQAKALGIPSSALGDVDLGAADGSIGFGAASEFTYGLTNGGGTVAPKTYDFFATALHEMTEVMGRQLLTGSAEDGLRNSYTLLDLLHYSGPGQHDFSQFTPGYFAVNGGVTNLGAFNTIAGGDAGDWASSVTDDPFDAFASSGVPETVTANDLTEMDAIGWQPVGSATPTTPAAPSVTPPAFPSIVLPVTPTFTSPFFPLFSPFSPFLPYTPTAPTRPATSPSPLPPTNISFAAESRYLAYAQGAAGLSPNSPLTSLAVVGGTPGDTINYSLSGPGAAPFTLVPTSDGATMFAGPTGVAGASGGQLFALTATATDESVSGNPSVATPLNLVVGASGSDVIRLASLPGITASAPTFVYGSGGIDTIDGTGMTGALVFDGGAGGDTMTGGGGANIYEYGATQESGGSAIDLINNFNVAVDLIDLTGLGDLIVNAGALGPAATTIAGTSVGWVTRGGNTFVYANTKDTAEGVGAADLTIELRGTIALRSADFAIG